MKLLALIAVFSTSVFADMVYMREDAQSKSIQLLKDGATSTVSEPANGQWAIYPDISPDGNEYVYCEGPAQDDLHLVYLNKKKNEKQLFHLPQKGMLLHPKFTKNTKLIFYSAPGPSGKNTVFFFNRAALVAAHNEGGSVSLAKAQALDASEESYFPRPSSDGNFVVYQRNTSGKKEIVLFDRLANKKKVLAEGMSPSLSPDERLIAFTAKTDGNWNVFTVDRTSGKIEQVTNDPHNEMAPAFKRNGTLVFASDRSGRYEIIQLKDNQWRVQVSDPTADFYSPQFAGQTHYAQKELAPFIGAPRSSFGTTVHEGKVYMAGGHQGPEHTYPEWSFTDDFVAYDIATNTWKTLAPRPRKAHGFQIAAHGNYVYAFGGFAYSAAHKPSWKSLPEIDRYDIRTNQWTTIGTLASPRSSNQAITIDGKVYIVGGWNSTPKFDNDADGIFLDTIEVFDLATEKLETASFKIPSPVRRAFTGIAHNGELVLIGGLGEGASHFELLNKVQAINPKDGSVRELPPLPFATFAPAAEVLGNELLVFGGMYKTGAWDYEYVAHIHRLDLAKDKWEHTGRYLKETKGFSQVFKLDEKTLGVLGGHHYQEGEDRPVSTFEAFGR